MTAHLSGIPIEETIGMYAPALLLALGAATANIRARVRAMKRAREDSNL